jgi:hypothetical protein
MVLPTNRNPVQKVPKTTKKLKGKAPAKKGKGKAPPKKVKSPAKKPKTPSPIVPPSPNPPNPSFPLPLPDDKYENWEAFVDAGGYDITKNQAVMVKAWVKSLDPVWIAEQIQFHLAIQAMRSQLEPSSRDGWADVLPPRHAMNFDFA